MVLFELDGLLRNGLVIVSIVVNVVLIYIRSMMGLWMRVVGLSLCSVLGSVCMSCD